MVTTTSSAETVDAVPGPVVAGDGLAQLGHTRRLGVAEQVAVEGALGGLAHRTRRRGRRLTGDQVDQVAVGALPGAGRRQQVHHVEGRHVGAGGDPEAAPQVVVLPVVVRQVVQGPVMCPA